MTNTFPPSKCLSYRIMFLVFEQNKKKHLVEKKSFCIDPYNIPSRSLTFNFYLEWHNNTDFNFPLCPNCLEAVATTVWNWMNSYHHSSNNSSIYSVYCILCGSRSINSTCGYSHISQLFFVCVFGDTQAQWPLPIRRSMHKGTNSTKYLFVLKLNMRHMTPFPCHNDKVELLYNSKGNNSARKIRFKFAIWCLETFSSEAFCAFIKIQTKKRTFLNWV